MSAMLESAKLFFDACETRRTWRLDAGDGVEGPGVVGWRRVRRERRLKGIFLVMT